MSATETGDQRVIGRTVGLKETSPENVSTQNNVGRFCSCCASSGTTISSGAHFFR